MSLRSDAAEIVFDHATKRYAGSERPAYRLVGVIAATIVVVVLAFAVDALFALVQRAVTPRGLQTRPEFHTIVPAGTDTAVSAEAAASVEHV